MAGMGMTLQLRLVQRQELRQELRLELRQCLQLEAQMNRRSQLPDEPPERLAALVKELKAKFNYDYYDSDRKYLEQITKVKDRSRLINFLQHNKSIYSFGGVSDKAIKKISRLFNSDCPEDIVYDYANLIITQDLLGNIRDIRLMLKNFEKNFEKLRLQTLQDVAEFMEIPVPETPQGDWDYSLLPMFIEAVLEFDGNGNDYDEDGHDEDDEDGEESVSHKIQKKLRQLTARQEEFENFFDEDQCDANFDPEAEDMEFVDELQRFVEERKLGFDEKVDLAVENAMWGRFDFYFMGDDANQFARYNRHALNEMQELGLNNFLWLASGKEDSFILQKKDIVEVLDPDEIIERTRTLAVLSMGSRKDGVIGYLVPGITKRMWGTVRKAIGKSPTEISTVDEAKLFLRNLQANWKQANVNIPGAMEIATKVGREVATLLKQLEMSFSNREGGLVTVKLWNRNVGTDIFLGNYSHCCVGVGECNHSSIYDWLALLPMNAITVSIKNARTLEKDKPVGAIFIAAFKEDGRPVMLVDGVEFDNVVACMPSLEQRIKLFIREFAAEVGFKGTPYYSERYVRLNLEGFDRRRVQIDMIGGFPSFEDELYFESYGGWTSDFNREIPVLVEPRFGIQ
jgi:hypothetical protein